MSGFLRNERGGVARWIIVIIIVAAAVYGYQQFKKTPRYAMIQFKKAIVFTSANTAQEFMDLDRVVAAFPQTITLGQPDEVVKKRLLYELDSPHEKSFFAKVKSWSVVTAPITISADQLSATAQPAEGTSVTLEKTAEQQWVITAIETE